MKLNESIDKKSIEVVFESGQEVAAHHVTNLLAFLDVAKADDMPIVFTHGVLQSVRLACESIIRGIVAHGAESFIKEKQK